MGAGVAHYYVTTGWAEWTYEGGGTEYCAAKSGPWVGMLPSSVADTPCNGGYMVWGWPYPMDGAGGYCGRVGKPGGDGSVASAKEGGPPILGGLA
jgi:hypothetical protein